MEQQDDRLAEHERRRQAAAKKSVQKTASQAFAESVLIQRKRKGWNQQQLAARLDEIGYPVHWTTVSKLEKGDRKPKLEDLIAFSVALDVSPVHMLGGSYLPHGTVVKVAPSLDGLSSIGIRQWLRGEFPLEEQDQRRFYSEVAPEEFLPPGTKFLSYRHKVLWLAYELTIAARSGNDEAVARMIDQLKNVQEVAEEDQATKEWST